MKEYEFATFTEDRFDDGYQFCPLLSIGRDKPIECAEDKCAWHIEWTAHNLYGCALRTSVEQGANVEVALDRIGTGTDFISDITG